MCGGGEVKSAASWSLKLLQLLLLLVLAASPVLCLIEWDFITLFGLLPAPPPAFGPLLLDTSSTCTPFALFLSLSLFLSPSLSMRACPIAARPRRSMGFSSNSSSSWFVLAAACLVQRKLRHYCDSVILLFCAALLPPPPPASSCMPTQRVKSSASESFACLVDFGISMGFCVLAIRSGY